MTTLPADLRAAIVASGYFPEFGSATVAQAIAEGEACVERMLPMNENEVQRFGLALPASDEQAVEI